MIKVTLSRRYGFSNHQVSQSYFENEDWFRAGKTVLGLVNRHGIDMDMVFTRMKNLNYNAPVTFEGEEHSLTITKNYDRV